MQHLIQMSSDMLALKIFVNIDFLTYFVVRLEL